MKKENGKFKSDYQRMCFSAFELTGNPYIAQEMIKENEKIAEGEQTKGNQERERG